MAKTVSFGEALSQSSAQLLSLFSVISQFFGALNALRLDWIGIAADLRSWAAGLSTVAAIGGFLLGWHEGRVLREEQKARDAKRLLVLAVLGMVTSYVAYWILNAVYTADSQDRWIDVSARTGFLLFY